MKQENSVNLQRRSWLADVAFLSLQDNTRSKFTLILATEQPLGNWLCKLNHYFHTRALYSLKIPLPVSQTFIPVLNNAAKTYYGNSLLSQVSSNWMQWLCTQYYSVKGDQVQCKCIRGKEFRDLCVYWRFDLHLLSFLLDLSALCCHHLWHNKIQVFCDFNCHLACISSIIHRYVSLTLEKNASMRPVFTTYHQMGFVFSTDCTCPCTGEVSYCQFLGYGRLLPVQTSVGKHTLKAQILVVCPHMQKGFVRFLCHLWIR